MPAEPFKPNVEECIPAEVLHDELSVQLTVPFTVTNERRLYPPVFEDPTHLKCLSIPPKTYHTYRGVCR